MSEPSKQSQNHTSSYAVLPSFIMDDENLEEGAKILYARISMYSQEGRCWASNAHFADKQKVNTRTIQRWLKQLIENGYIEVELEKGGFQTKRNIWIIVDFKKNFTKRHTCHPDATYMSPPHDVHVVHTMSKQDNENIDKDNVSREKTLPRSKDQKETLPAKRRWKLTEEQFEHFEYLKREGVDSDEGTLAHWCKTYSFQRIYDVLQSAKSKPRRSIGAYMNKLFKDDIVIENSSIRANLEFAKEYKKCHQWAELKIGKKYVTIDFGTDKLEISLNLSPENFMNVMIEKHEIYSHRG